MQDFRKLKVWQKAHELTLEIYRSTQKFPREELYGLTSQMRRAAASIGANLAEGCCRHGDVEFGRFIQIALGSISEVDYHLLLARDLGFLADKQYAKFVGLVTETRRMLISLLQTVRTGRIATAAERNASGSKLIAHSS